ncbi:TlpA family protein disulfide reductase [Salirhabdus sp. Marseille-P4669]|uniref:TlpA family protein disulfide reductase n=1 Tax=Salirhabdus sp. Marseille-P4669 TaxID=2042310 RepID=UPI000C7B305B|nr:TlpA disulfide reductase family protein [Salirhabdus sp. Marseille-P4669]
MRLREKIPILTGATSWLNGRVTNSELNGLPTLIHFWSISCNSCKDALPNVNQLRKETKGKLNILAVHMPRSNEDKDFNEVKNIAKQYGITQPIYIDDDLYLSKKMKVKYVPAYYLFDANGLLRHVQSGKGSIRLLEKRIERVLQ